MNPNKKMSQEDQRDERADKRAIASADELLKRNSDAIERANKLEQKQGLLKEKILLKEDKKKAGRRIKIRKVLQS